MFWSRSNDTRKTPLNSNEYESCVRKFVEISARLDTFETKVKFLQTDVDNLRGNFSRKLKGIKLEEEKDQKPTETVIKDEYVAFG